MDKERIVELRKENSWAVEECLDTIERLQAELFATRTLFMRWGECDQECSSHNGEDVDCDCGWNQVARALASNLPLAVWASGAEAKESAKPERPRCASCGNTTLFETTDGGVVCTWVDCNDPLSSNQGKRPKPGPVAAPAAEHPDNVLADRLLNKARTKEWRPIAPAAERCNASWAWGERVCQLPAGHDGEHRIPGDSSWADGMLDCTPHKPKQEPSCKQGHTERTDCCCCDRNAYSKQREDLLEQVAKLEAKLSAIRDGNDILSFGIGEIQKQCDEAIRERDNWKHAHSLKCDSTGAERDQLRRDCVELGKNFDYAIQERDEAQLAREETNVKPESTWGGEPVSKVINREVAYSNELREKVATLTKKLSDMEERDAAHEQVAKLTIERDEAWKRGCDATWQQIGLGIDDGTGSTRTVRMRELLHIEKQHDRAVKDRDSAIQDYYEIKKDMTDAISDERDRQAVWKARAEKAEFVAMQAEQSRDIHIERAEKAEAELLATEEVNAQLVAERNEQDGRANMAEAKLARIRTVLE